MNYLVTKKNIHQKPNNFYYLSVCKLTKSAISSLEGVPMTSKITLSWSSASEYEDGFSALRGKQLLPGNKALRSCHSHGKKQINKRLNRKKGNDRSGKHPKYVLVALYRDYSTTGTTVSVATNVNNFWSPSNTVPGTNLRCPTWLMLITNNKWYFQVRIIVELYWWY